MVSARPTAMNPRLPGCKCGGAYYSEHQHRRGCPPWNTCLGPGGAHREVHLRLPLHDIPCHRRLTPGLGSIPCFLKLAVPTHARKLQVRAPIVSVHPSYTGRSVLQAAAMQIDSTTPGHSPSIGHGSPPN